MVTEFNDNTEVTQPKESIIYDEVKTVPSVTPAPYVTPVPIERNEYESIYATPADVKIDVHFDNQIPSIHPIKREELWNYVYNTPLQDIKTECKVKIH